MLPFPLCVSTGVRLLQKAFQQLVRITVIKSHAASVQLHTELVHVLAADLVRVVQQGG